ncbi:MAG: dihydropteroate synthase [Ignavibacteriales bacterium]|nr:MAG: dihydropteroate synthase [Ignavibacteriales bacterium]
MGIVNVTPDSFSDGGKYYNQDSALHHALKLIDDGADIIDIGGESTRPGSEQVSEEEEKRRIIPVIKSILNERPGTLISVDTTKSKVAKSALDEGAVLINDISGLTFDYKIAELAAEYNAALVIMHIQGEPKTMQVNPEYQDVVGDIYQHIFIQAAKAAVAGVKNIIVDTGIGFGKTVQQNFELLDRLEDFKSLGYPLMIGVSRKSFIGKTLNLDVDERDTATIITEAYALNRGASIIRTHNVKNAKQLLTLHKNFN